MIEESFTDVCGAVGVERYFAAAAKIDAAHHQRTAVFVLKMGTFYADHLSTPCGNPFLMNYGYSTPSQVSEIRPNGLAILMRMRIFLKRVVSSV